MDPVYQILVIDSNPQGFARLRAALPAEYILVWVENQASLQAYLFDAPYDLILVEPWQISDIGPQLQKWILNEEFPAPVIILTANRDPDATALVEKINPSQYFIQSESVYQNLANVCRNLTREYRLSKANMAGKFSSMMLFNRSLEVLSFNSDAKNYVRDISGKELAVGMNAREFLFPDDFVFLADITAASEKLHQEQWSFPMPVKQGEVRWLMVTINVLFDNDQHVTHLSFMIQDQSHVKQTEDALRQREETLRVLINASPGATFLTDPHGIILAANDAMSAWFNKSHKEFIGTNILDYLPPDLRRSRQKVIKQMIRTGKPSVLEDFNMGRYLRTFLYPAKEVGGRVHQIAFLVLDVTDQKLAEEVFQRRDSILQAVSFASEQFLQAKSWRERIREVLKRWSEATSVQRAFIYKRFLDENLQYCYELQYGWDNSEKTPDHVREDYQHLSFQAIGFTEFDDLLERGQIIQVRKTDVSPEMISFFDDNGVKALLHVPVFLDDHLWGFVGFADCEMMREWSAVELAAVKIAADIFSAALRREQEELSRAALLNALPDLMFLFDQNGAVIDFHTPDDTMLAVPPEKFLGKRLEDVIPGEVADITRDAFDMVIQTGLPQVYRYKLAHNLSLHWEGRMVRSGNGAVAVVRDITEQLRFEEELRQAEEAVSDLYEITSSNVLTFEEKQKAMLRMGCQRFDMEHGSILRPLDDQFEIISVYSKEYFDTFPVNYPLQESFSYYVLRLNQTLAIERAAGTHWEKHPAYRVHKIQSYLGSPLLVGGEPFGVLAFGSAKQRKRPFTQVEQRFIHLMSQWIGLELEREKYLGQLQQYAKEISLKIQELAVARDEALEVSRLKSEFLATMSHEIRTPMNAVIGMTELLLDSPLNAEQLEYAETVRDSARLLLSLLNNVLDYSKIEAGKLVLEQAIFDPQKVLDDAVALFGLQARQKNIELNSFVSPKIPRRLKGDALRFSQVLINLIANAVRFTEQGNVMVWSDLLHETTDGVEVMIRVRDTGIGISEDSLETIFQPFAQGPGNSPLKHGGTGLGLTIAKRLVDMMDGTIGVESVEGAGSIFWFTAKFQRTGGEETVEGNRPNWKITPGERILVYESLEEARQLWRQYLEDWNLPFEIVETPQDVINRLKRSRTTQIAYACCVLDYDGMRCLGGKVCREVLNLLKTNHSRAIMVTPTGDRMRSHVKYPPGLLVGRLARPFSRNTLERLLSAALQPLPGGQLEEAAVLPDRKRNRPVPQRLTEKKILVVEDNRANRHLAAAQLQSLGYRVTTVSTGFRAVGELEKHYQDYALVLMDLQMPDLDGYQATRLIRKAEGLAGGHIPIVAMTASVMLEDRQQCLEAGMDEHISKPVLMEDLRRVIARCLSPENFVPPVAGDDSILLVSEKLLDERTLADLRSLSQPGEPDFFQQLVDIFLEDSETLMKTIHAAESEEDRESLRRAVHSLKGISSNLGALRLSDRCWQVESRIRNGDALGENWLQSLDEEYAHACEALRVETLRPNLKS